MKKDIGRFLMFVGITLMIGGMTYGAWTVCPVCGIIVGGLGLLMLGDFLSK